MSAESSIEWTDSTWNPVIGCTKVSPGCANCYAEKVAVGLIHKARGLEEKGRDPGRMALYREVIGQNGLWNSRVLLVEQALEEPLRWKKPRRVFVNSMSDLFHTEVPVEFIARVFAVMATSPQHAFQILTKRPDRMRQVLTEPEFTERIQLEAESDITWPLPNVWLGTSVENQAVLAERAPHLLMTPAQIHFLSCEPLLAPLNLDVPLAAEVEGYTQHAYNGLKVSEWIEWVIVGGESGPGHRPIKAEWVRSLRDQCRMAAVPFFFKQWGGARATSGGRLLEGRTWDQVPRTISAEVAP